ncbi:hypothetical protein KR018_007802 [Drosophila ironensis]|nr:hypothetical protein KR018_007802 [Drosophila ironensis]
MYSFLEKIEKPPLAQGQKSYQPIREANLVGDVTQYLAQPDFGSDVSKALKLQRFFYGKYGVLAEELQARHITLTKRIEAAKANLELVGQFLIQRGKEHDSLVQIAPGVLRRVCVPPVSRVFIQVSMGLQMEFGLQEAGAYIMSDLTSLVRRQLQLEHDLDYLQDQVSNTELNMGVLYNHSIEKQKTTDLNSSPICSGQ